MFVVDCCIATRFPMMSGSRSCLQLLLCITCWSCKIQAGSSEHGMEMPSASHKCLDIGATLLQKLFSHWCAERKPTCSQQFVPLLLSGMDLSQTSQWRAFRSHVDSLSQGRAVPAWKSSYSCPSEEGKQYRHTATPQGYQFPQFVMSLRQL